MNDRNYFPVCRLFYKVIPTAACCSVKDVAEWSCVCWSRFRSSRRLWSRGKDHPRSARRQTWQQLSVVQHLKVSDLLHWYKKKSILNKSTNPWCSRGFCGCYVPELILHLHSFLLQRPRELEGHQETTRNLQHVTHPFVNSHTSFSFEFELNSLYSFLYW